ncbi:MAG: hypothetical protein HQL74_15370 [Magnetococcales bacterium]|nr:hypothetical protein [Magnetococcales bacterium]
MARKKPKNDIIDAEPTVSVLEQTEPEVPVMGIGQVIEEEIHPWNDEARLAEEQMAGDMAKLLMEQIKTLPRQWHAMTESQQSDVYSAVSSGCANLAGQAIELMASRGRRIIKGIMKKVTINDDIQLTISCQRSPEACTAMGMAAAGGEVAFLLLHTEGFLQLGSPFEAEPEQRELDLGLSDDDGAKPAFVGQMVEFLPSDVQTDIEVLDTIPSAATESLECPL